MLKSCKKMFDVLCACCTFDSLVTARGTRCTEKTVNSICRIKWRMELLPLILMEISCILWQCTKSQTSYMNEPSSWEMFKNDESLTRAKLLPCCGSKYCRTDLRHSHCTHAEKLESRILECICSSVLYLCLKDIQK